MSRQLRVLALLGDAYDARGGIAQYNRDWIQAVLADGRASVRAVEYSNSPSTVGPTSVLDVRHARSRFGFFLRSLFSLQFRPNVVFCGHLHLAPVAALVAFCCGARLWLQVHGIEAWPRPSALRRRAAERADLITAVSRYTARRVRGWAGVPVQRVRVLPDTYEQERFIAGVTERASSPTLLTVARLAAAEAYKGHDRVIALLPRLRESHPEITYRIVGDGDDQPRLERLAREFGVADLVKFLPHVDREQLPAEMARATAFVMPSTGEGFGIAYLEAMGCGTPAIGLDGDGSSDPLADGELGACVAAGALHDEIVRVLDSSGSPEILSARTRARFGREPFQQHLAQLMRWLIESPSGSETGA